jgi:hypothetical protein
MFLEVVVRNDSRVENRMVTLNVGTDDRECNILDLMKQHEVFEQGRGQKDLRSQRHSRLHDRTRGYRESWHRNRAGLGSQ